MKVLVVDDEKSVRFALGEVLLDAGYDVIEASTGQDALAHIQHVDLILSDLKMPVMDGLTLLKHVARHTTNVPFIMLTARGSEQVAVSAMKAGAFDYLPKPFDIDDLLHTVELATKHRTMLVNQLVFKAQGAVDGGVIAQSAPMQKLLSTIERIASRPVTVLLGGETGVGKEVVASLIHGMSARADAPMVRFNCASLPDQLAEAELFGYERGAFTGAHSARPGYIRQADGGSLLLDEIGELSPTIQAKLLRFLQEGEVQPLGAGAPVSVDVRVIASTHRNLQEDVAEGRFRADLYYRLAVVALNIPPLRERVADVRPLARLFLNKYARRFGAEVFGLEEDLLDAFERAPWPGNVRELENTIARLVALSDGPLLDREAWQKPELHATESIALEGSFREMMHKHERQILAQALKRADDNRSEAARNLQLSRSTLIDKLKRHGLMP